VLSFYSVVSGWSIAYLLRAITGQLQGLNSDQIGALWSQFLGTPWQLMGWHTLFMVLTIGVIIQGVQQGLERVSKLMMPSLYVILIILMLYAAKVGDFYQGFNFLFGFRFSQITPSIVLSAMGHAFFTLALGAGAMLMYGAYVPQNVNITKSVFIVAGLDILVAFLAGLAIFPLVFANHLPAASGPGLMFVSLPIAFAHIHGGAMIGSLFFLLLLFAAWTSSINMAEPIVSIFMTQFKLRRTAAACLTGFIAWLLGIISVLSFNVWQSVTFFHLGIFDILTGATNNIMLPIGGLCFALFVGWILTKPRLETEMQPIKPLTLNSWLLLLRYLCPLAIAAIFISSLL